MMSVRAGILSVDPKPALSLKVLLLIAVAVGSLYALLTVPPAFSGRSSIVPP